MTVKTYAWLDPFYKIRDKISSFVDSDMDRSFLYQKIQREGKTTRNVVVNFDWETGTVRYRNFDDQKPPVGGTSP